MTADAAAAHLEPQPFDARFVGGPVFRLVLSADCGPADVRSALGRAERNGARLVTARIPVAATSAQAALAASGFRSIERLVTFELPLAGSLEAWPAGIRFAEPGDVAACAEIGRTSYKFDRYHADERLDPTIGDVLKEAWVRNDLAGRADACLVAVEKNIVAGFNLCLLAGDAATIDLIAVSADHQGQGLGRRLTLAGAHHYVGRARVYRASTQAGNVPAVRLYQRLGFALTAESITYHWMPGTSGEGR
jgi:GNAT superfamily N-acetyltransferase